MNNIPTGYQSINQGVKMISISLYQFHCEIIRGLICTISIPKHMNAFFKGTHIKDISLRFQYQLDDCISQHVIWYNKAQFNVRTKAFSRINNLCNIDIEQKSNVNNVQLFFLHANLQYWHYCNSALSVCLISH